MSPTFDLLSLGEILLRLSPVGNERIARGSLFEKTIGGAELNVASGVSLLGLRTGILSRLPANALGTYAKNQVRFLGVSDDWLVYDDSKDARLGVYYYESGAYPRKPGVVYDRRHSSFTGIATDQFSPSMYESTRCFHTSGITLALCEKTRETAIAMIRAFKEQGALISFDVNFRGNLWTGPEARACIEGILPMVDIFFCSEETARLTFGMEGSAEEIMRAFTCRYPIRIVASTQRTVHSPKVHDFTSVIYDARTNQYFREAPYEHIDVIDRIGSGDAYVAGVLYGLLSAPENLSRALSYGNACSAVKNTIPGDLPSCGKEEIDRIIAAHHATGRQSEMDR
jgi:2-dehydro-3-deoxygluconokinase